MTSRERMLCALRRQDVDYVPCCPFFSESQRGPRFTWTGYADSLGRVVNDLGLDTYVTFDVGASVHPDVESRVWRERPFGERFPVLHKEIGTPAGPLTAAVRITEDWPHGDDIPLNSDWNVSRFVKPWLETEQDVESYRYVQMPPSDEEIARARACYASQKQTADEHGVITLATCGSGLTAALQLFGAQQAVAASMDSPQLIGRFLGIEHEATLGRAAVLAELGVDVIRRNGFYETTDFWSPKQIELLLAPLLREEIEVMRSGGSAVLYTVCTGIMPILDLLADLEFDAYDGIEPALGGQDMSVVARKLCERHAIWGGVSGPIHIGEGTPEIARQAVRDAFGAFGPRGLVLCAVPSIRAHWRRENVEAMFDEWRSLRDAP